MDAGKPEPTGKFDVNAKTDLATPEQIGAATAEAAGYAPGTKVGHYELIRLVGKGGKGQVWAARDTRLGRRVAVKFMNLPEEESAERFLIEAKATAKCQHDNIVVIYEVAEDNGSPYLVLEYLEGETLESLVSKGPISPRRTVDIAVSILRAIVRAHSLGVIHRDLKPANVLITRNGTVKVLDFGMAKAIAGDLQEQPGNDVTSDGQMLGTPAYMAPEQLASGVTDEGVDIWALGIIMYQMLSGVHPLGNAITLSDLVAVSDMSTPMPSATNIQGVPTALGRVVDSCLRKDRSLRYQEASETLAALEPLAQAEPEKTFSLGDAPYLGLSSFQEQDVGRFFGRSGETRRAVSWLDDHPLLAVVGPSGAGKSSFVRAGVGPALSRGGEVWKVVTVRPGRNPLFALASMIRKHIGDPSVSIERIVRHMKKEPGYFARVLRSWCRAAKKNVLLFIDQFEELYTQGTAREDRLAYTACLSAVADDTASPLRLVLAMRSDFVDRAAEDSMFMDQVSRGLVFLGRMNRASLRNALVRPLEMAGHAFESDTLVEKILDELESTEGALPLLQFAGTQLWDHRDRSRSLLTEHAYDLMGGVAGALVTHADHVMNEVGVAMMPIVRSIFQRLVTTEKTRDIAEMQELLEMGEDRSQTKNLIEKLVHARLLVVNSEGEQPTVEIVHESLVKNWPRLGRWIDEEAEAHGFVEHLQTVAKQWDSRGRPASMLWRGDGLLDARRWRARYPDSHLTAREREYLYAAFEADGRAKRVRRSMLTAAMAFLGVVLVGASLAVVFFNKQEQKMVEQKQQAGEAEKDLLTTYAELQQSLELETRARVAAEKEAKTLGERAAALEAQRKEVQAENLLLQEKVDSLESQEELRRSVKTNNPRKRKKSKKSRWQRLGR